MVNLAVYMDPNIENCKIAYFLPTKTEAITVAAVPMEPCRRCLWSYDLYDCANCSLLNNSAPYRAK